MAQNGFVGGFCPPNSQARALAGAALAPDRAIAPVLAVIGPEMAGAAVPAVAAQKRRLLYGGMNFPFEALYNVR